MIYSVVLLSVVQQSESVVCVFIYVYGAGNGSPLQYSCLENPVNRGAWWASVHGVAQNRTRLRQLSTHHALEKEMATHSSVLAWRIPGTEEPGGLPSMGSYGVGHDWSYLAAAAACIYICVCVFFSSMAYYRIFCFYLFLL